MAKTPKTKSAVDETIDNETPVVSEETGTETVAEGVVETSTEKETTSDEGSVDNNPHVPYKADIGLGDVSGYPTATGTNDSSAEQPETQVDAEPEVSAAHPSVIPPAESTGEETVDSAPDQNALVTDEAHPEEPSVDGEPVSDQSKDPITERVNLLMAPFYRYAELMGAGYPNTTASIARNQRDLFKALRNLLSVDNSQVFSLGFKELLELWNTESDSAFNAGIRLYRQIDSLQLSAQESIEFNTLLCIMEAIRDPATRKANLLQIDLNRALPEIGGVDQHGYLASYVRRF